MKWLSESQDSPRNSGLPHRPARWSLAECERRAADSASYGFNRRRFSCNQSSSLSLSSLCRTCRQRRPAPRIAPYCDENRSTDWPPSRLRATVAIGLSTILRGLLWTQSCAWLQSSDVRCLMALHMIFISKVVVHANPIIRCTMRRSSCTITIKSGTSCPATNNTSTTEYEIKSAIEIEEAFAVLSSLLSSFRVAQVHVVGELPLNCL